jgi:hypothetical protein
MMSVTLRELIHGLKGAPTSIVRARRDDTREQLTANSSRKRTDVTKLAGISNAFPKLPVSASQGHRACWRQQQKYSKMKLHVTKLKIYWQEY